MPAQKAFTLPEVERMKSQILIGKLFAGGKSRSMAAFPLRVVYMFKDRENLEPQTQMLVSVPKRCFKRAVKRNRAKRQVREAYRHYKHVLLDKLAANDEFDRVVVMAFIWLDKKLYSSDEVNARIAGLMNRISEKL